MPIRLLLGSVIAILCLIAPSTKADTADARFCIVPVQGAEEGIGIFGSASRKTFASFRLPGSPAPVFAPLPGSAWTISADRRAIPYIGADAPNALTIRKRITFGNGGHPVGRDGKAFELETFRRTLVYEEGFLRPSRWRQSTPDGGADIPGGNITMPSYRDLRPNHYVYDLSALGRTLIEGANGLFLFDGSTNQAGQGW
jgi:hypothetical protein